MFLPGFVVFSLGAHMYFEIGHGSSCASTEVPSWACNFLLKYTLSKSIANFRFLLLLYWIILALLRTYSWLCIWRSLPAVLNGPYMMQNQISVIYMHGKFLNLYSLSSVQQTLLLWITHKGLQFGNCLQCWGSQQSN